MSIKFLCLLASRLRGCKRKFLGRDALNVEANTVSAMDSESLAHDARTAQEEPGIREAVGVFHSAEDLQRAIDALLSSGFHRSALSLLASEAEVVAKLGHVYRRTTDLAADPQAPRIAYVSPEAIGDGKGAVIATLMYVGAG